MKLSVPGIHNVSNSLACFAACSALGIPAGIIKNSLRKFKGTHRRFEHKGTVDGIKVVDDYAHHPTEVIATLKSARSCTRGKVLCVFQPHTYTRTKEFINEFSKHLLLQTRFMLQIFMRKENDNGLVHSSDLVNKINEHLNNAVYIPPLRILSTLLYVTLRQVIWFNSWSRRY